jgi:hypothetical protein
MPEAASLLIRRQPGVTPIRLSAVQSGCDTTFQTTVHADTTITLADLCR